MDLDQQNTRKKLVRLRRESRNVQTNVVKNHILNRITHDEKMESLGNLAAEIAHDFNNILQTILGYTQLALLSDRASNPHLDTFQQIEKIVLKGRELTEKYLTLGRKRLPGVSSLDLNKKIVGAATLLRRMIPTAIDIQLDLSPDLKKMQGDTTQIDQVLMNLSMNARDAMPQGGRLLFKTRNIQIKENDTLVLLGMPKGEYVLLSVEDTGRGISPEHLGRIYEPFFTTKAKTRGTGLGLPIVYSIVKNHRGHIECTSKPNVGTVFLLYFPASRGHRDHAAKEEVEHPSP